MVRKATRPEGMEGGGGEEEEGGKKRKPRKTRKVKGAAPPPEMGSAGGPGEEGGWGAAGEPVRNSENGRTEEPEISEREAREKVALQYQKLKEDYAAGVLTRDEIFAFIKGYKKISRAQYDACLLLAEDIESGAVTPESAKKLEKFGLEKEDEVEPRGVGKYKVKMVRRGGRKIKVSEVEKKAWTSGDWYNFLSEQYGRAPAAALKRIKNYLEKNKDDYEKYSPSKFELYNQLWQEIEAKDRERLLESALEGALRDKKTPEELTLEDLEKMEPLSIFINPLEIQKKWEEIRDKLAEGKEAGYDPGDQERILKENKIKSHQEEAFWAKWTRKKAKQELVLAAVKKFFIERDQKVKRERVSQEEIDKILMDIGFREELAKDIPTKEGKTIFEEMLDEQIEDFRQFLRNKIKQRDLDNKIIEKKAEEIQARVKVGPDEARTRAEALFKARQEAVKEVNQAQSKVDLMHLKERLKRGEVTENVVGAAEKAFNLRSQELNKLDVEQKGAREKAERELVSLEARKFLATRELVVHHKLFGYDPETGEWGLGRFSDLDGTAGIALLGKAGIDISKGEYVSPGAYREGKMNIDTLEKDGFVMQYEKEKVIAEKRSALWLIEDLLGRERATLRERTEAGAAEGDLTLQKERVAELEKRLQKNRNELWEMIERPTVALTHHGGHSDRKTSAAAVVYRVLSEFGLLKFEDEKEKQAYERLVDFVTRQDNFDFPEMSEPDKAKAIFPNAHRTILGLRNKISFDDLLKFFLENPDKKPTDVLTDDELLRYGWRYSKKKKNEWARIAERQRRQNEKTIESIEKAQMEGWAVPTKYGIFLLDIGRKVSGELQWAAASKGYAGILRYNPETHGFFIALGKGEFDPKTFRGLEQGKLIRKSMFLHNERKEKLLVNLEDLLGRLAPAFKPSARTEVGKFFEKERGEGKRIRTALLKKEIEWGEPRAGEVEARVIAPEQWQAHTDDGLFVLVLGVPDDFKSGELAFVRLKNKRRTKSEGKEIEFWEGEWEAPEIVTKEEKEKERGAAIEEVIEDEMGSFAAKLRVAIEQHPTYSTWSADKKAELIGRLLAERREFLEDQMSKIKFGK
jgi:hypothetical protein